MGAEGHADGTVSKALDVLDMVAGFGRPVRFSDLLTQSAYPKATLYRLLQTLTHQGMLTLDPDTGTYALGVRLVRLAHAAWAQSSLAPIARPYLDELAAKTGETIHLAQMDQGQVLYVDKRNAAKPVEMFAQAGKVGPAYCTGVGKAALSALPPAALDALLDGLEFRRFTPQTIADRVSLLAELADIRACGVAYDMEEHEPGIRCVAAPIVDPGRALAAGVSVTGPAYRVGPEQLAAWAPHVRLAAEAITGELSARLGPQR